MNTSNRQKEALAAADAGLAVNSSYALLYRARAVAEVNLGRYEEGKSDLLQAIRLSPRDPRIGLWRWNLGLAELGLKNFDAAIDECHKATEAGFRSAFPPMCLAAAYALAGKIEEAKTAIAEAQRINPKLTVKWQIAHQSSQPALLDGLRKAGLPEE